MPSALKKNELKVIVEAREERDCKTLCLDIIDFSSPYTGDEINAMMKDDPTLGKLGISSAKCDREVRALINKKIRVPNGKPRLPTGSVKTDTKAAELIKKSCA